MNPRPVCQATLQLLKITSKKALINLENLNPRLFTLVHELNLVRRLRYELHGMRKYLLICRFANKDRFLWKNVDTPHLIESPDLYSLQDLMDTYSGDLPTKLHALTDTFLKHIKVDCELCKGRGYLCEICTNDEVLFPFDEFAYCCSECGALLHKHCFKRKNEECPRCKRRKTRKQNNEESITSD
ncbi:differentially expressed in FDCP 8 homolog B-like [Agrilus planipennis]|uniref:Differentially expressed in FDCP 8 homolog B-like n=1 Tax=Agrilus planipennis TaxID=224129 RepID=A0A7F5R3Q5_AGRPL|nr:differentially expressed in FDCP 8 homolog B-like [Agrilus planipennis]